METASWLAAIGLILTGFGLIGTWTQLRQGKHIALGEFLLHLDELFWQNHHDVHVRLRPGGEWSHVDSGPENAADWANLEAYMGLFERIYVLIDKDMLDTEIVDRLYRYRIRNIVRNERIRENKLIREQQSWRDFIALCELLKIDVPAV